MHKKFKKAKSGPSADKKKAKKQPSDELRGRNPKVSEIAG